MKRAVITGMGIVSPFGAGRKVFSENIFAGKSASRKIKSFDTSAFPTRFFAECELSNQELDALLDNQKSLKTMSRPAKLAMIAADEAMINSGLDINTIDPFRFGTSIGAGGLGLNDLDYSETFLSLLIGKSSEIDIYSSLWYEAQKKIHPLTPLKALPNVPTSLIAIRYNAMGECHTTTTACTSSTQSIGEAYRKIKFGLLDAVICGGSDSMTTPFGLSAFSILGVLSKNNDEFESACRPFDKTRDGFVIGEGAAMFVVEEYEHCRKRGGLPLAEISGYASTNDAYRLTDEPPDARGSIYAMKSAIADAEIQSDDIDYINAHGTGTKMNDKTETFAIKSVLGDRSYSVPVTSTKSMIGHLVSAAGAAELAACLEIIQNNIIHPTINYKIKDEECDLDYVPNESREAKIRTIISNSFGFGGQNACLIIKKI
jgi:3-oxoacyl-[acyl-carrier-protein] synthase II